MAQNNGHSILARKVLAHIVQSYSEKSESSSATETSLIAALASLKPFEPTANDIHSINRFLIHQQASDVACKAAWALYKDFVNNDNPGMIQSNMVN